MLPVKMLQSLLNDDFGLTVFAQPFAAGCYDEISYFYFQGYFQCFLEDKTLSLGAMKEWIKRSKV